MKKTVNKVIDQAHHLIELVVMFFSPAAAQMAIVGLAVFADTATGIWAATKAKENVTSRRLADMVPKLCVYIMLVLLAHGIERVFALPYSRTLVALGLLLIELVSIEENFKKATGRGLLKPLIGRLRRR